MMLIKNTIAECYLYEARKELIFVWRIKTTKDGSEASSKTNNKFTL